MASERKKEKGINLKENEIIEIISLIRDINYKDMNKQTKRPVKKKCRYDKP